IMRSSAFLSDVARVYEQWVKESSVWPSYVVFAPTGRRRSLPVRASGRRPYQQRLRLRPRIVDGFALPVLWTPASASPHSLLCLTHLITLVMNIKHDESNQ